MRPELVETWNGPGFTPSLFQTVVELDAACIHVFFSIINLTLLYFRLFSQLYLSIYSLYGNDFDLCLCFSLLCRSGNNHFDVHFRRIGPYFYLSKYGKDAVREGRNG